MILEYEQFPIGQCEFKDEYSKVQIEDMIFQIETFPKRLELTVQGLLEFQLETPYRKGGWTINQVIHHCADSHMNALIRIKLALSESQPTIKPYMENLWATMNDYSLPFNNSITLLFCVHEKIISILKSISDEDMNRTYFHPENNKIFRIKDLICLYAWHCNHHLAHVKLGIEKSLNS